MPKSQNELLTEIDNTLSLLQDVSQQLPAMHRLPTEQREIIEAQLRAVDSHYKQLVEITTLDAGFHFLDDLGRRIDEVVNHPAVKDIYSELHRRETANQIGDHDRATEEQKKIFNHLMLVQRQLTAIDQNKMETASCSDEDLFTRRMGLNCREFSQLLALIAKERNKQNFNIERITQLVERAVLLFDDIIKKGLGEIPVERDAEKSFFPTWFQENPEGRKCIVDAQQLPSILESLIQDTTRHHASNAQPLDSDKDAVNVLTDILLNYPIARYFHQHMNAADYPDPNLIRQWQSSDLLAYFSSHPDWLGQFSEKHRALLRKHADMVCKLLQHPSGMDDTGSWDGNCMPGLRKYLGADDWQHEEWKTFIVAGLSIYERLIGVPIAHDAESRESIRKNDFNKNKRTVERIFGPDAVKKLSDDISSNKAQQALEWHKTESRQSASTALAIYNPVRDKEHTNVRIDINLNEKRFYLLVNEGQRIALPPITALHIFRGVYAGYAARLPEEFHRKYQTELHQGFLTGPGGKQRRLWCPSCSNRLQSATKSTRSIRENSSKQAPQINMKIEQLEEEISAIKNGKSLKHSFMSLVGRDQLDIKTQKLQALQFGKENGFTRENQNFAAETWPLAFYGRNNETQRIWNDELGSNAESTQNRSLTLG